MRSNRLIFYSLIFTLFLLNVKLALASTYTVTKVALDNTVGSLDYSISHAVTDADAGATVSILFDAPGLVQITYQLPNINNTNGSITIDLTSGASSPQGIQYASTAGDNSIGWGLRIGNASGSTVTVNNITLRDFVANPSSNPRDPINAVGSHNALIQGCTFINNNTAIFYYETINLTIQNNQFTNIHLRSIWLEETATNSTAYNSSILYNHFLSASDPLRNSSNASAFIVSQSGKMNHHVDFKNNADLGDQIGMYIWEANFLSDSTDHTFTMDIENDSLSNNIYNIWFINPFNFFVVKNNTFDIVTTSTGNNLGIESLSSLPNVYGIDFINTNGLSYPTTNTGNTFSVSSKTSIEVIGYFGVGVHFIGQTLPGEVDISSGYYTTLRSTKIVSKETVNLPISLGGLSGNGGILQPVPVSGGTTILFSSITINYTLSSSLSNTNAPYVVDFYRTNTNGDLLDYLGNQTITSLTGGTYQAIISTGGFSYSVGDRIAMTLTSLGTGSMPTNALGTSQAAYATISSVEQTQPCQNCIGSFRPQPGKTYLVSAWVKESGAAATKTSYTYPQIAIGFPSVSLTAGPFSPSGEIIDGWQRIEAQFKVPASATNISITLQSTTGTSYFDDVRIFPFDGSMKSYVYDPTTLRLTGELDERNYATIYEYDEEGKLTRVKKETENGIMTIKESKSSSKKTGN